MKTVKDKVPAGEIEPPRNSCVERVKVPPKHGGCKAPKTTKERYGLPGGKSWLTHEVVSQGDSWTGTAATLLSSFSSSHIAAII